MILFPRLISDSLKCEHKSHSFMRNRIYVYIIQGYSMAQFFSGPVNAEGVAKTAIRFIEVLTVFTFNDTFLEINGPNYT